MAVLPRLAGGGARAGVAIARRRQERRARRTARVPRQVLPYAHIGTGYLAAPPLPPAAAPPPPPCPCPPCCGGGAIMFCSSTKPKATRYTQ